MGVKADIVVPVITLASPTTLLRRAARGVSLLAALLVALAAAPAHADVPEGWSYPEPVDPLHFLVVVAVVPITLFLLIALAVYLPSMIRGERLLPDPSGADAAWLGGPGKGAKELPAASDDAQSGGGSGSW